MKKLILIFTIALLGMACEKENEGYSVPSPKGTMNTVITTADGTKYKWGDLDPSSTVYCACYKLEVGGTVYEVANESDCENNGAGSSPCD